MIKAEAYKHGYNGSYCPPEKCEYLHNKTFSVGCFQWLPKAGGKGLKKSAVIVRVKGRVSCPESVYAKAAEICTKLNGGWRSHTKTITVW